MLTLRIAPYTSTSWEWTGAAYTTGDGAGHVTPYAHPMVEQLAVTDGTRTLLAVRERVADRPACASGLRTVNPDVYDELTAVAARWPADQVLIETAPHHPVRVTAGAAGTTPLYLAHADGVLHGSWDMADLRTYATGLASKEAARLLIYRPRYGAETLFKGITRLTERATATFGGDLHIRYPEPALHAAPRELAPGADVLAAFTTAIDQALDVRPIDPATTLFHLTGGLDSGTLATRAAARWPGRLNTATLIVIGPGRQQQIRRRKQILAALPFGDHDLQVDAGTHLLFAPAAARVRGEPVSPYEEPLHHPFSRLTDEISALGAKVVVTGLGGDEMVAVSPEESEAVARANAHITDRLPWLGAHARAALEFSDDAIAPPAVVGNMTLLSLETTAPPLLRAGLWPLHPFTDPGLIRLGEQLPFHWRDLKRLQRRRLATFGLSDEVCTPVEPENFVELVRRSLMTDGMPLLHRMLRDGSPLIDAGLVDPDGLSGVLDEVAAGVYDEDHHSKLLEVLTLDMAARAFLS
ncbi:asparagine synthase-related protein [Actinomadura viridis]|uniref:asparagine synthase-related protein n=1 Tax=Actinomadura viridis TaxID=58110 RepID=UPI00369CF7A1